MMKIQSISHAPYKYPSFSAEPVKSSLFKPVREPIIENYGRLTDKMAYGFAKIFERQGIKKKIESTKNNKHLLRALTVFVSFVLTSFYMQQTLKSKELDEQKKKTLAINQGLCFILPSIGAWVLDERTDKWIEKHFSDKYSAVNFEHPKIKKIFHGIGAAKSMMVFVFMYRFFVPVFVTPLANYIGNKMQEKKSKE